MLVDGSGSEFKAVENNARGLGNGAGIQAAQMVANLDVTVVITGDLGPNAFRVLNAAGIRTYQSSGGAASDVLSQYRTGKLREISAPTGPGHHGRGGQGPRWMDGRPERR